MTQFNHPELGNLVGLISLLISLSIWRNVHKLPARLVDTNNKIMKESAFAFFTDQCRFTDYVGTYGKGNSCFFLG